MTRIGNAASWGGKAFKFGLKWIIGDLSKPWRWLALLVTISMFVSWCSTVVPLATLAGWSVGGKDD